MRTVAYTCPFVPAEWIAAFGLRPARLLLTRPAGAAAGANAGVCPFAHALAEAAREAPADAFVVTTVCDQMRRSAELIARDSGRPTFLMHVPQTWQDPAAGEYYLAELRRLGDFLAELGGRRPTDADLAETMHRYDAARTAIRRLRGSVSAKALAETIAALNLGGPNLKSQISDLKSEISDLELKTDPSAAHRADRCQSSIVNRQLTIPVALVGGPLMRHNFDLYDQVAAAGGHVALDATETGELWLPAVFDRAALTDRPLAELARAYFGEIPHAFRRPNTLLYDWLRRELAARSVRGILFVRYVWCDTWSAEIGRMREVIDLPLVEVDLGDDAGASAAVASRVQALIEVLGSRS